MPEIITLFTSNTGARSFSFNRFLLLGHKRYVDHSNQFPQMKICQRTPSLLSPTYRILGPKWFMGKLLVLLSFSENCLENVSGGFDIVPCEQSKCPFWFRILQDNCVFKMLQCPKKSFFLNWAHKWETTQFQEAVGSTLSTICWMDISFFHIDLLQKLYCLLEKDQK